MSFWVGFADAVDRISERKHKESLFNQKRMAKISDNLLTKVLESRKKLEEASSARAAIYKKGVNLFGERVATILENTGQLSDVLSNYEGTKNEEAWTKTVMARTEKYITDLLESNDPSAVETGTELLKRGSMYSDADIQEQQDYIHSIIADGVVTQEEYASIDLSSPQSTFMGQGPVLGTEETFSPEQVTNRATRLAASAFEGGKAILLENGSYRLEVPNVNQREVQAVEAEIANRLEELQYSIGPQAAETQILKEINTNPEAFRQSTVKKYGVPLTQELPSPPEVEAPEGVDSDMVLQERMGGAGITPEETPRFGTGSPTGFAAGVLDSTQERFE